VYCGSIGRGYVICPNFALSLQVGDAEKCWIAFLFNYGDKTAFNWNIPAQSNVRMEACDTRNRSCNSVNICGSGLLYLYISTVMKIFHGLKYICDSFPLHQHSVEDCSWFEVYLWQFSVIPTQCWRLFMVWSISVTSIRYTNTLLKTVRCLKYISDSDTHGGEDCSLSVIYLWLIRCTNVVEKAVCRLK
jgi:hypothetical protein